MKHFCCVSHEGPESKKQYTTDAVGGCWRNPAVPAVALPMLVWRCLKCKCQPYLILFDIIWSSKENNTQRLWGAQTPKHQAVSLGTFAAGSAFSQRLKQCLLHPSASRCIPGIGHWTSAAIFIHFLHAWSRCIRTTNTYAHGIVYILQ